MKKQLYSKYLIVFLDVLGFKKMVERSESGTRELDKINKILQEIKQIKTQLDKSPQNIPKPKMTIFSDSILLSRLDPDIESLIATISVAARLQLVVIKAGGFLRGATVIDDFYQSGDIAFGPALVKAFEMESKLAIWPRVIVNYSVLINGLKIPNKVLHSYFLSTAQNTPSLIVPEATKKYIENVPNGINKLDIHFKNHSSIIKAQFFESFKPYFHENLFEYIDYMKLNFIALTVNRWTRELKKKKISKTQEEDVFLEHKKTILNAIKSLRTEPNIELWSRYHALAVQHNRTVRNFYDAFSERLDISKPIGEQKKDLTQLYNSFYIAMAGGIPNTKPDSIREFIRDKFIDFYNKREELFRGRMIALAEAFPDFYR